MAALPMGFGPTPALAASKLSPALAAKAARPDVPPAVAAKARATAQDFEAVFLNAMFGQMFSGVGEGPFSGGQAAKTWQAYSHRRIRQELRQGRRHRHRGHRLQGTDRPAGGARNEP